ncbi:hypothetical protein niasHT_026929 [Heterodera trifolii]|uniref:MULE transposase domain-containing protein n=1 Tax=Heterodera trifolii TaxID=157864 RepID=A0ABD2KRB6_9BILA
MACFSQRIGSKSVMLSDHTDNSNLCYKWTRAGMEQLTGLRYVCAGCRKLRDAKHVPKETPLPTRKAIGDQWVDDGPMHAHFCQPFERAKVQGEQERRKVQNELAMGSRENVASAKVRIDVRVVQNYMNISEEERNKIRNEACGNAKATKKALYRAQTKRFMNVHTLQGLAQNDCRALWITLRARSAAPESPFYDELLMRYLDDDLAIFASPRQLQLLKKSAVIVSDGTFKQAPKGIYQVYRVFGFVAATHAVPLCTALMRGKSRVIYQRLWSTLRQELEDTEGELMISQANFDFEPASIEEFRLNFIHVHCKMCCFHVRQAMHRRIQRMGLANLYTSREQEGRAFQALIRKIGALQFAPPNHVNRSVHLMQQLINESEFVPPRLEIEEQIEEAAAMEEAEASLNESGIYGKAFAIANELNGICVRCLHGIHLAALVHLGGQICGHRRRQRQRHQKTTTSKLDRADAPLFQRQFALMLRQQRESSTTATLLPIFCANLSSSITLGLPFSTCPFTRPITAGKAFAIANKLNGICVRCHDKGTRCSPPATAGKCRGLRWRLPTAATANGHLHGDGGCRVEFFAARESSTDVKYGGGAGDEIKLLNDDLDKKQQTLDQFEKRKGFGIGQTRVQNGSEELRIRLSGHEVGHWAVGWYSADSIDHLRWFCIWGNDVRGWEGMTEFYAHGLYTHRQYITKLATLLGGRAAEMMLTGSSVGHVQDEIDWLALAGHIALITSGLRRTRARHRELMQQYIDEAHAFAMGILRQHCAEIEMATIALRFNPRKKCSVTSYGGDVRGVVQPEHVGPPRLPDPVQLRCPTQTAKHGVALKRLQTKRRPKPMPEANISQESSMRANGPAPMSPYANHRNGAGGQYRNGWTQSTDGTFPRQGQLAQLATVLAGKAAENTLTGTCIGHEDDEQEWRHNQFVPACRLDK